MDDGRTETPQHPRNSIPRHVRLRIASAADVDPRTLDRYLAGRPTRGMGSERIAKRLAEAGYAYLARGKIAP